ncbi:MAG: hypothetical protein JWO65_2438 [Sphingomonas bacterium]|nr:hypothetical protein [Sphingomonas bacterium]
MRPVLLALLLAGQAAPPPPTPAGPDIVVNGAPGCGPPFARVHISPMGAPFRSDGFTDPAAAWFAQADANHDGRLTLAEFAADADRFFATLDTDHDGEIDPQEVIVYESQVAPEIRLYKLGTGEPRILSKAERKAAKRAAKERANYDMAYGAGRFAALNIPEPVASADLDINRGVSRAEFATVAASRFGLLDSTNRGYLTLDMLPRSPAQQEIDACRAAADKAKKTR